MVLSRCGPSVIDGDVSLIPIVPFARGAVCVPRAGASGGGGDTPVPAFVGLIAQMD
ncbi:MAG: hypothetical protein VX766_07070 [Pseudomonadota bacterium]|nr:hypothetical protein [Pseudomonadota bacterium]